MRSANVCSSGAEIRVSRNYRMDHEIFLQSGGARCETCDSSSTDHV